MEHDTTAKASVSEPTDQIAAKDLWADVRLVVEHGYLTIREGGGWLLWSAKLVDIPLYGLQLEEVLKEAAIARFQARLKVDRGDAKNANSDAAE